MVFFSATSLSKSANIEMLYFHLQNVLQQNLQDCPFLIRKNTGIDFHWSHLLLPFHLFFIHLLLFYRISLSFTWVVDQSTPLAFSCTLSIVVLEGHTQSQARQDTYLHPH